MHHALDLATESAMNLSPLWGKDEYLTEEGGKEREKERESVGPEESVEQALQKLEVSD